MRERETAARGAPASRAPPPPLDTKPTHSSALLGRRPLSLLLLPFFLVLVAPPKPFDAARVTVARARPPPPCKFWEDGEA